jgi:hypothetical protein
VANQYLMYQGIPLDGDTPQPMFEAKWDVPPIKVVAQADYDALSAQLAESRRMHDETSVKWQMRVDQCDALEAELARVKDREPPHCASCSCGLTQKTKVDQDPRCAPKRVPPSKPDACSYCFGDGTVDQSDGSKRGCELCDGSGNAVMGTIAEPAPSVQALKP